MTNWRYFHFAMKDPKDEILFRMNEGGTVERLDRDGWRSTEGESIRRGVLFGEPGIIEVFPDKYGFDLDQGSTSTS